jgi:hypothetical protein
MKAYWGSEGVKVPFGRLLGASGRINTETNNL